MDQTKRATAELQDALILVCNDPSSEVANIRWNDALMALTKARTTRSGICFDDVG
jgi:hypothetical protein